ncbi:hypothetical protein CAPTEDRAFT_201669, partial [Capitella teleta]
MSLIPEVHAFDLDCFPSDHAVLYYDLSIKKPQLPHEKRIVYNYKRANFDQLISELVSAPLLDLLMQASNVDELWALWQESVNKAVESCVPKITFCNSNDPPWFDGQTRHLVNRKRVHGELPKKEVVNAYGQSDPAPSIPVPHFSVDDVASVLSHLDVSKACTPDDIAPIVLKKCGLALAPSLAVLFNTMLYTGSVPENWKLANVIPVFKKGDKQDAANYRPISLLCIVSKVME